MGGLFFSPPLHSSPIEEQKLSITEPDEEEKQENRKTLRSLYYPYKQSMSPRLGGVIDPDLVRDGEFPFLFGISYMLPRNRSPQVEFTFDLLTNSKAHLSAMLRRIFYERESFRPFVRAGVTLAADSDERLATFSNWENYLARASIGMEDVIEMPMSVRLEMEVLIGSRDQMLVFSFGYSWAW